MTIPCSHAHQNKKTEKILWWLMSAEHLQLLFTTAAVKIGLQSHQAA
jgi:hypothetical protein